MNVQEYVSSYPPFQPAPMPENAAEAHFILLLAIVTWMVAFTLLGMSSRKNK